MLQSIKTPQGNLYDTELQFLQAGIALQCPGKANENIIIDKHFSIVLFPAIPER
jgi:hypothetical protein